jgi:predicted PurR-regulated permease PerM
VPFYVPLAVLVFLGAFIPIVGAVVTGFLAVIVALVYNDPVNALIMLAVVIGVNQLESHVLQPLLMGGAVRLHPIAVVLAVAVGSLLAGIAGGVFAVPVTAALNSAVRFIAGGRWKGQPEPWTGDIPGEQEGDGGRDQDTPDPRPKDVTTVA